MRQKLIIASAFIHKPDVIVVDEPMVGLDPKAARILKDLFGEYTHRGHTIMMSTHTLEVADTMCDRIGIIQGGKIRALGTMDELRASSSNGTEGLEQISCRVHLGSQDAHLAVFAERVGADRDHELAW